MGIEKGIKISVSPGYRLLSVDHAPAWWCGYGDFNQIEVKTRYFSLKGNQIWAWNQANLSMNFQYQIKSAFKPGFVKSMPNLGSEFCTKPRGKYSHTNTRNGNPTAVLWRGKWKQYRTVNLGLVRNKIWKFGLKETQSPCQNHNWIQIQILH